MTFRHRRARPRPLLFALLLAASLAASTAAFAQTEWPAEDAPAAEWKAALASFHAEAAAARGDDRPLLYDEAVMFSTSGVCASCHQTLTGSNAMLDGQGNDVSPPADWRSTMMANAFRDPLYRAKLAKETSLFPALKDEIENVCLTCHAPMAHREAHAIGGDDLFTLADAEGSNFANDGVSCTVCHQTRADGLGDPSTFNGQFPISTEFRTIYGPYENPSGMVMRLATGFAPEYGAHKQTSEVCATCHTLFTTAFDVDGNAVGNFPEQTPYLEWKNSVYAAGPEMASCQDCHMPKIADEIHIANSPSDLAPRSPFWKHHFAGGNAYMLRILRDNADALGATASTEQFDATIARTLDLLQNRSIDLAIAEVSGTDTLRVVVSAANKTGHKFPTSYPSRRAWLRLKATDGMGATLFESGAYDADGHILGLDAGLPYEPHRDFIDDPAQAQIYETITGDNTGAVTHSLLRAFSYLKDNRLPPRGYTSAGPDYATTAPAGVPAGDLDFNRDAMGAEGTGADLVAYQFSALGAPLPISIEVEMLYQTVAPEFAEDLFERDDLAPIAAFKSMHESADKAPTVVARRTWTIDVVENAGWVVR